MALSRMLLLQAARHSASQGGFLAAAQAQQQQLAPALTRTVGTDSTQGLDSLPLKTGTPRVVVVGTGWGGARLLRDIDPKAYNLAVISQRNHMVFTPLLASTTVGTLDPRSVTVGVTDIQKALFWPQNSVLIATATAVDPHKKLVHAQGADGLQFQVQYDKLVLATGSQGSTFGIPGVLEHTHFLRDVHQAEAIRNKLIDNIARAGLPGRDLEEWRRLLSIVVVGGGPTGVEVAGELTDFINQDLKWRYPERAKAMRVTLVEAREVLGSFFPTLREYAARKLVQHGVQLRKGVVKEVTATEVVLTDGTVLPYGLCIWSTGVGPTPFITSLPFAKTPVGRLAVDNMLRVLAPTSDAPTGPEAGTGKATGSAPVMDDRVTAAAAASTSVARPAAPTAPAGGPAPLQVVSDVYALGDCCANMDKPLPALAQVAEQQGRYLAALLNSEARVKQVTGKPPVHEGFVYRPLGSMATVGDFSGVMELNRPHGSPVSVAGLVSWFTWRAAYLTRLGSMQKRILVAMNWALTFVFGRDLSRW